MGSAEGLPECHAVHALLKAFLRHVHGRFAVMPEVVRNMGTVAAYAGVETSVNGQQCPSEGDALLCFEMQAALREMLYFQTVAPYWNRVFRTPELPPGAAWLNLLEHHDETFMGFFQSEVRVWLAEYVKTHGGVVYKNGMSAGGRIADCLNYNAERIATALFVLFITPGTPLVYAGTELGCKSDFAHAKKAAEASHEIFHKLGLYSTTEVCFDPRELQRARISTKAMDDATAQGYAPVKIVRRMNELRRKAAWLRTGTAQAVDSGDVGVLCAGRGSEARGRVLCMANLTACGKWVCVPEGQACSLWGLGADWEGGVRFVDVVEEKRMRVERGPGVVKVWLEGFGRGAVRVDVVDGG